MINKKMVGLCALALCGNVDAALVTVTFDGTIDKYTWQADTSIYSVPIGAAFSGKFTYDSDPLLAAHQQNGVIYWDPDYDSTLYRFTGAPYGFEVTIDGIDFDIAQTSITILDTATSKPDGFLASSIDRTSPQNQPKEIFFSLGFNGTSSMYTDTSLPDSYPADTFLSQFSVGVGAIGSVVYQATGAIDNVAVSAVPIPAAAWLFSTGMFGLLWGRNRKMKA